MRQQSAWPSSARATNNDRQPIRANFTGRSSRGLTIGTSWFPAEDASVKWTIELLGMLGDTTGWRIDGDPAILQLDADQFAIRTQIQISL